MRLFFIFLIFSHSAIAQIKHGTFSGRVSRINEAAKLMRVRTTFKNMKFLNKDDAVLFWNGSYANNKCKAFVKGKSPQYILFRVPNYSKCITNIMVSTGTHLFFDSKDLESNIKLAEELVHILLKKRTALDYREERIKGLLDSHQVKVDAVNARYETLKQKLETEWDGEVLKIEEERNKNYTAFKATEARLNDVDHKLERYRVHDKNLELDRWSLDPDLYYRK